jgi:hypothetical protein
MFSWLRRWCQRLISREEIIRHITITSGQKQILTTEFIMRLVWSTTEYENFLQSTFKGISCTSSQQNGRFDHKTILSLFIYDLFDPTMSLNYSIGSLSSAPIHLSLYWAFLTFILGPKFTILFHLTRCTLSYACYVLREIIDHSGLPSTSILEFTRTSPCCNAFQKFLQPHDDNYHLLHHLLPRIPMTRLHESHLWLVSNLPEYERANSEFFSRFGLRRKQFLMFDRIYNLF